MSQPDDHRYMARAIQLAAKGLYSTQPNPRVGCVIVNGGQIVGEGYHRRAGGPHAEIHALQQAAELAKGSTVYVSLEPCSHHGKTPPCADALIEAGVARVVCAMQDPNPLVAGKGMERLQAAGIEAISGVLQGEAEALNPGFIKRMQQGMPYVRIKLAMSLDGRTAMHNGESQWITGEAARLDVQRLRARSSVVLTGSGTVLHDNPSMNVRVDAATLGIEEVPCQPLRAVIDSELKTAPDQQVYQLSGESCVFTRKECLDRSDSRRQVAVSADENGKLQLREVLQTLAHQQANEIHVEAGAGLCGALLQQGLVDEVVIYMASHIMGDSARGLFHLPGLQRMEQRIPLKIADIRAVGNDWRIRLHPQAE